MGLVVGTEALTRAGGSDREPSVDIEMLAADEAGPVGGEEAHRLGQVDGVAVAAQAYGDGRGEIVLVVDTFPDALRRHSEVARDLIASAGRLTWSVARTHLAANDRVGVVVAGSRAVWLPPRSGRRRRAPS